MLSTVTIKRSKSGFFPPWVPRASRPDPERAAVEMRLNKGYSNLNIRHRSFRGSCIMYLGGNNLEMRSGNGQIASEIDHRRQVLSVVTDYNAEIECIVSVA